MNPVGRRRSQTRRCSAAVSGENGGPTGISTMPSSRYGRPPCRGGRVEVLRPAVREAVARAHPEPPVVALADLDHRVEVAWPVEDERRRAGCAGRHAEAARALELDTPVTPERRVRGLVDAVRALRRARDLREGRHVVTRQAGGAPELRVERQLPHPVPGVAQALGPAMLELDRIDRLERRVEQLAPGIGARVRPRIGGALGRGCAHSPSIVSLRRTIVSASSSTISCTTRRAGFTRSRLPTTWPTK